MAAVALQTPQPQMNQPLRLSKQTTNPQPFDTDMMMQLYELLQGDRATVTIYSKALGSEICFVNPAMENEPAFSEAPVYTTRELAFVLSLSAEEFRRYHYLKMQLV